MVVLKKVVIDDLYETIDGYVKSSETKISDYEGMVELIISMIKEGYCFAMDRDLLRDAMESLTYMYAPEDDINKDRLVQQLVDEDDDDDDESEDDEMGGMDLMKMMQMMGAPGAPPPTKDSEEPEGTEDPESDECKKVATDVEPVETETTVVKEE